jgi:hypothetical protein
MNFAMEWVGIAWKGDSDFFQKDREGPKRENYDNSAF